MIPPSNISIPVENIDGQPSLDIASLLGDLEAQEIINPTINGRTLPAHQAQSTPRHYEPSIKQLSGIFSSRGATIKINYNSRKGELIAEIYGEKEAQERAHRAISSYRPTESEKRETIWQTA